VAPASNAASAVAWVLEIFPHPINPTRTRSPAIVASLVLVTVVSIEECWQNAS